MVWCDHVGPRDRVRDRVKVMVRVSVSCASSEAFVGIAAVGIAACTHVPVCLAVT